MKEKEEIKKKYNIYIYYWVIPFFIAFVALNYFANLLKIETFDIGVMVSVVTFLFGFFITISFSMVLSRVGALKEALAQEAGRLVSLFLLSKHLGKRFNENLRDIIDRYTMKTLRHYTNYEISRVEINEIYESCSEMEIKSELQKQASASFLYILGEFEPARERLEYLTQGGLLRAMKIANYTLAIILISLLFLNRGDPLSNILFIVLSTTVVFILLIIEDYEDLRIGDYINNISNSEQIFDLLEKERYYPETLVGKVTFEEGKKYRIGIYDSKEKVEKIFVIEYTKKFNNRFNNLMRKVFRRNSQQ